MNEMRKAEDKGVKSTQDILKKWNDYYINNNFGIGIQCDKCKKWREVFQYQDPSEVPEVWICSMWKMDKHRRGSCRIPSDLNEDNFAEALYAPGSLVWAKLRGFPWWPAMVEDCPDVRHYFISNVESEHEYHVNFFGKKPLRSWIKASLITDFSTPPPMTPKAKKNKELHKSIEDANEALKMTSKERLKMYSFAVRYKGPWAKVKELDIIDLPPNILRKRRKNESTDSGSQLIIKEPHGSQDCDRTSTVKWVRNAKSESETLTKRKSADSKKFQPLRISIVPQRRECPTDLEHDEKCEDGNSSELRSKVMAEEPQLHRDCQRTLNFRKVRNIGSKSETATKRKFVNNEEFQPDLQSVGAENECPSNPTKESEEEISPELAPLVMAEESSVNQDCHRISTIRKAEDFQQVQQSNKHKKSECPAGSEKDENSKDSSRFILQVIVEEPHVNQDCPSTSTVKKVKNIESESEPTTKRKIVDNEESQTVQQSIKHKRNEYPTDSEKEDAPVLNNTINFSDSEEEDSSVLNNSSLFSDSEEEESPAQKAYAELLSKEYPPLILDANTKSLSGNDSRNDCSHGSSDLAIHYEHDNFSVSGSIIIDENAAEFLETDTGIIPHENATECTQNDSGANNLDTDSSLPPTAYPSCSTPKSEQFPNRCTGFKKNRELLRELINSSNSKYMPYSFYRGRIRK